jgi:hypothetical protein
VTTNLYGGSYTGLSGIFPTNTGNDYSGLTDPYLPKPKHIPMAAIIGGAVGLVIIVIFILVVGWRYRRRRVPKQPPLPAPQYNANANNNNEFDKAELAGTRTYTANNLSTNPSVVRKPSPGMGVVSPVSPLAEKERPALAGQLEMEAQSAVLLGRTEMDAHNTAVAHGQPYMHELHPEHARYEVPGHPNAHELADAAPRYEVQGSNQHPVEVAGLSANMNSGPHYELGNYR